MWPYLSQFLFDDAMVRKKKHELFNFMVETGIGHAPSQSNRIKRNILVVLCIVLILVILPMSNFVHEFVLLRNKVHIEQITGKLSNLIKAKLHRTYARCVEGLTMDVIPFSIGSVSLAIRKNEIEITDSPDIRIPPVSGSAKAE
jgi:hypothetical protein